MGWGPEVVLPCAAIDSSHLPCLSRAPAPLEADHDGKGEPSFQYQRSGFQRISVFPGKPHYPQKARGTSGCTLVARDCAWNRGFDHRSICTCSIPGLISTLTRLAHGRGGSNRSNGIRCAECQTSKATSTLSRFSRAALAYGSPAIAACSPSATMSVNTGRNSITTQRLERSALVERKLTLPHSRRCSASPCASRPPRFRHWTTRNHQIVPQRSNLPRLDRPIHQIQIPRGRVFRISKIVPRHNNLRFNSPRRRMRIPRPRILIKRTSRRCRI